MPKQVYPDYAAFSAMAKKANIIPIYEEILADTETPVSAFLKVAAKDASAFLFESVEHGDQVGRYSFIGTRPAKILQGDGSYDNTRLIEAEMKRLRLAQVPGLPSFCGGYVGFLAYESVKHFEKVKLRDKESLKVPQSVFFFIDTLIIFDHVEHTMKIVALCKTDRGNRKSYDAGMKAIDELTSQLRRPIKEQPLMPFPRRETQKSFPVSSNVRRADFENKVRKAKEYIRSGDCIQIVLSQRFYLGEVDDPFDVYRSLRSINPSPYMFYFKHKSMTLVGSSPEVLVRSSGATAEVRPIAGTRKRGQNEEEDKSLESDLKKSVKELAEHLMLVDLGRNDLGRVCRYDSVKVMDYARIERYSHVMHLVSDVKGSLRKDKNAFDLLRSVFPAGTVSGAPKVRAMEIIDELEDTQRGPYAGCMGYFSFNGDMDMCIMIRTILVTKKKAYVQAGAGIVFDSVPSKEYQETVNKARALFQAVAVSKAVRP